MPSEKTIRDLKERYGSKLMAHPAVSGVGIETDDAGEPQLVVHLSEDAPDLPEEIEGCRIHYDRRGPYSKQ